MRSIYHFGHLAVGSIMMENSFRENQTHAEEII